jgi:hypothetical protein
MSYDEEEDLIGGIGEPTEDDGEPLELPDEPLEVPDDEEFDPDSRYH